MKLDLRLCMLTGMGLAMLAGCGATTDSLVQPDQEVTLQPNQGFAAVVMDTLDALSVTTIKSPDNKDVELDLGYVDKGVHMYVYAVPAGTYCLVRFNTGFYRFHQESSRDVCFDVVPGKVAYSGNLAPRAVGHQAITYQNYDWAAFKKMFKEQYPKLANYPIVSP